MLAIHTKLVNELLSRLDLPKNFEDAMSSKMLMSIEYDGKELISTLISNEKITLDNIKQFIYLYIGELNIITELSFGILLKFDNKYSNAICVLKIGEDELENKFVSSGWDSFTSRQVNNRFEIWSSGVQPNNARPQIDENGNFI